MYDALESSVDNARLGRNLAGQLFVLFKTALNYAESHSALQMRAAAVVAVIREIQRQNQEVILSIRAACLYLGDTRVKVDSTSFEPICFILNQMQRHHVGAMVFHAGVTDHELMTFAAAVVAADEFPGPEPFAVLLRRLQQRMIVHIEVEAAPEETEGFDIGQERLTDAQKGRRLYRKCLDVVGDVVREVGSGGVAGLRGCKRLVQQMVDLLHKQERSLLGQTASRPPEESQQRHAVNVCILSMAIGRRAGLSKVELCQVGMAALFHDLGKMAVQPHSLDEDQPDSLYAIKKMMQFRRIDATAAAIVTAMFDHLQLEDRSGYHGLSARRPGLAGKIIDVADSYERLCNKTRPRTVVALMLQEGGNRYDLPLLKLLIDTVGIDGVGALLLLPSGELAVELDWRRVRIIDCRGGNYVDGGIVEMIADVRAQCVVADVNPAHYNIDVGKYLN